MWHIVVTSAIASSAAAAMVLDTTHLLDSAVLDTPFSLLAAFSLPHRMCNWQGGSLTKTA
jgi:hypothetical protein